MTSFAPMALLVLLLMVFGAAGGWISLSGATYGDDSPRKDGDDSPRGAATRFRPAHAIIGICGAVVAVAGSIKLFGLQVDAYVTSDNIELSMPLFVAAISVLGGYSAPTLIPLLANAAIAQLQRKVDELGMEVKDNNRKQRVKLAIMEDRPGYAIDLISEVIHDNPTDNEALALKASALKRLGRIDEAIDDVTAAIRHADPSKSKNRWLYHFNLACYLALRGEKSTDGINCKEVAAALRKARELVHDDDAPRLSSALERDLDLKAFRTDCSGEYAKLVGKAPAAP